MKYYFDLEPRFFTKTDRAYDLIEVLNKTMCTVIQTPIPDVTEDVPAEDTDSKY